MNYVQTNLGYIALVTDYFKGHRHVRALVHLGNKIHPYKIPVNTLTTRIQGYSQKQLNQIKKELEAYDEAERESLA